MGQQEDFVDRAFALIAADDRRKLHPDEDAAARRLWRASFRGVRTEALLEAVQEWLEENPRGRPNVGKIKDLLRSSGASPAQEEAKADDDDRVALRWAVAVLEALDRRGEWAERMSNPNYQHTEAYALKELRHQRFEHWHDAKAHLEPGWAPVTITEVYL